jgi:galactose oxidase
VLVTGGVSGAGFNSYATGVHEAELWNPETGAWTTLAANAVNRAYHAVSLLPNGAVLHGASGDASAPRETSHEIFLPPYMFRGNRPTITSGPATVGYGQTFEVQTSYAAQITGASLIRLGSVTHTFDQSTRFIPLALTAAPGEVSLTAPSSPNIAPPGHYLLFLVNRNGVPSEGRIIQLQ